MKKRTLRNESPFFGGGAKGIRTPDLLNAIQTRYQLRHNPEPIRTYYHIFRFSASICGVNSKNIVCRASVRILVVLINAKTK